MIDVIEHIEEKEDTAKILNKLGKILFITSQLKLIFLTF